MSDCFITRRGGTSGQRPQLYSPNRLIYHLGINELIIYDSTNNGSFTSSMSIYKNNSYLDNITVIDGQATYIIEGLQVGDTIKAINHNVMFLDSTPFEHVMQNTDIGVEIFSDAFNTYTEGTTISSGRTPFTVIYNGTGDGNQKIISYTQPDETTGMVLQLQGASNWSSKIRHNVSIDNTYKYIAIECDIFTASGTTPGGIACGSSSASGQWSKAVFGMDFSNGKIKVLYNDGSTQITNSSYELNRWYHVKVVLDTEIHKQFVYLDNTLLNPSGDTAASVNVEWLDLNAGNSGTNTIYFDNVRLYEYA